jgi:hypothetical protein
MDEPTKDDILYAEHQADLEARANFQKQRDVLRALAKDYNGAS